MPSRAHGDRLDRLQKIVADLATTTRVGFDQIQKQTQQTDERFRETDARWRETDARFRQTDERIDKLVSAMGEYIRRSEK